jgi:hypothetical protein
MAARKSIGVGPAIRTPTGIATRRLNVFEPSTFVRLVTLSSFWAARTLTNASGRLVPAAMTVSPHRNVTTELSYEKLGRRRRRRRGRRRAVRSAC